MSPQAFRQQIDLLIHELEASDTLCQSIRTNRRLGSTTHALDLLQNDLLNSATQIDSQFKILRSVIGSRMDLGDETARSKLNHSIRELQLTIQPRLSEIAYGRREQRDLVEVPGFRKLHERWMKIDFDVQETLEALGQRLKSFTKTSPSSETGAPKPARKSEGLRSDELIVSRTQLDDLVAQMKLCWEEREVHGEVCYVNVFDEKRVSWTRPIGGYIRALEKKRVRVQEPESYSRRSDNSKGW